MSKTKDTYLIPAAFLLVRKYLVLSWIAPFVALYLIVVDGLLAIVIFFVPAFFGIISLCFLAASDASRWAQKSGFNIDSVFLLSWGNIILNVILLALVFLYALFHIIPYYGN